jgi:2-dehydro-3-deoxygluconokinase
MGKDMTSIEPRSDITQDDLTAFAGKGPALVTFGETLVRDTPGDLQRLERTAIVNLSLAGSEYTLAMMLSRLGIPSAYITRVPDNPYGWLVRDTARGQGINTDHIVWAPKTEPIGRFLYELGRTPHKSVGWYQRMYSAASRLGSGMVDWKAALQDCRILHVSGISFGLSYHSKYERNYILEAFEEGLLMKPKACQVGLDFNYRATLWSKDQCRAIMTPLMTKHVDVLITTIEDMAALYGIGCGQWSPDQIDKGEMGEITDQDLRSFVSRVGEMFKAKIVAVTIRYPDSFEQHRWESAAMDDHGHYYRSAAVRNIMLLDRLGGGDTWNGGFYYGLLTAGFEAEGLEKGVLVGDAATRLKQTLMFDLPMVTKAEVRDLMKEDVAGGGKRVAR